ncbi:MAG: hypothetical protein IJ064_06440 [Bacteroidaceae bacterium]|nr:hypothetical protein [Bacteroidaceae bacterium]
MKIIRIRRHPWGGEFTAINLCGLVFARRELTPQEMNHERIHTAQQRELLFLPFFVWYVLEWLVLCAKHRDSLKAYYRIRFEEEAYRHQNDLTYLQHRRHYRYS